MEFTVKVLMGDVFINGQFVAQLCWDGDSIGTAIASWINGDVDDTDNSEEEKE